VDDQQSGGVGFDLAARFEVKAADMSVAFSVGQR